MFINEKPKEQLREFLLAYKKVNEDIDLSEAARLLSDSSYKQTLDQKWYDALAEGNIDYSVYGEKYYFTDLWNCWIEYSRRYLKGIVEYRDSFGDVEVVVDLGCGIGYTTASLKQMFPSAFIYGTNIEGIPQWTFDRCMAEKYDFSLVSNIVEIDRHADLVFASEYFEHIERPLEHLKEIIDRLRPRVFVVANSFNTYGVGHFTKYRDGESIIPQEKISKLFTALLKYYDYRKLETKLWNNKPSIFIKDEIDHRRANFLAKS